MIKISLLILFFLALSSLNLLLLVSIAGFPGIRFLHSVFVNENHIRSEKEMKVIGCGFPRTGTISTKLALEILGYKVYHGEDNAWYGHSYMWAEVMKENPHDPQKLDFLIEEMLRLGYTSNLDFPSIHFCVDFYHRFPNAKVLLNVRDSAEQWYKSFQSIGGVLSLLVSETFPLWYQKGDGYGDLVFQILDTHEMSYVVSYYESSFPWVDGLFIDFKDGKSVEEESAKRGYLRHIEKVKASIPEDKLLVFNVKEGWGPLLEFLEVDEARAREILLQSGNAFPRKNLRGSWFFLKKLAWFMIYSYPFLLMIDGYLVVLGIMWLWKVIFKVEKKQKEY